MGPGGGQSQTDQTANFFWLLILIFLGLLALWWVDHTYIVTAFMAVRGFEIDLVKWFADGYTYLADYFHLPTPTLHHSLAWWQNFIATHPDHSKVTFDQIMAMSHDVGQWLRFPVIIILVVLAMVIYFRHSTSRFIRTYSMDSFRKSEVVLWPQIAPVVSLDLVKEDINKGPWAMAMLPLDYCKQYQLIEPAKLDHETVWVIKKGDAYRQFVMQLGQLWQGPEKLPIHLQALFVAFVAHAERKSEDAQKILQQVAASSASGKLNFTGVKEMVAKYRQSTIINWLDKRHAYVGSYMASLLELCRVNGVMASSEFLWLKPLDRRMWYMLNSVGRQTSVIEVSGLFAHWLAEKRLKRALKAPMVKMAVVALEVAVSEILFVADEDQWHSNEA